MASELQDDIKALQGTLLRLQLNLSATVLVLGKIHPSLEKEIEDQRQELLERPAIKALLEALGPPGTPELQKLLSFFSGPIKGPIQ